MEIFCGFPNGKKGRKHQLSSLEKAGGGKQPPTNIISTNIISTNIIWTNNDYVYTLFLSNYNPKKAFLRFFGDSLIWMEFSNCWHRVLFIIWYLCVFLVVLSMGQN